MINATNNESQSTDHQQLAVNATSLIFGLWAVVGNGIIILTIGVNKELRTRKEMVIVAGMAIGDFLYGVGQSYGGGRRIYLILINEMESRVTRWYCMKEVATFFYIVGPQIASMMNLVISIDRFIAVTFFKVYQLITVRAGRVVTGIVILWSLLSYFTGFVISYTLPREAIVFKQCLSSWSTSSSYVTFYTVQVVLCSGLSVVIYMAVMVVLKISTKQASEHMQKIYYERQMQVTKTLGIVTLVTLIFYVIPWLINITLNALNVKLGKAGFISPLMWLMIAFNNAINIVIYMTKFTDMRRAFLQMIGRNNQVQPNTTNSSLRISEGKF